MNVSVYSFADATGLTQYVDSQGDFLFNGTWSSAGTYVAAPLNAVQYGVALYMCIRDNVGDNPQRVPTRTRPQGWSIMSLLYEYQDSGSNVGVAEEAYALAQTGTNIAWAAYWLAQIGTNTGSAAYDLAGSAYALAGSALGEADTALAVAEAAFAIAVIGTNAAATAQSTGDAAYALAQVGTNTGSAALGAALSAQATANQAFSVAVLGTNAAATAQSTANSAFSIAVIGTGAAATAQSTANAAYALAQIGTNVGTAALTQITTETGSRTAADLSLQNQIFAEQGSRSDEDNFLFTLIQTEQGTRAQEDQFLQNQIIVEQGTRSQEDQFLQNGILAVVNQNIVEQGTRSLADQVLQNQITAEIASRAAADQQIITIASTGTAQAQLALTEAGTKLDLSGGTLTGNLVVPNVQVSVGTYPLTGVVSGGTMIYSFTGSAYQRTTVDRNIYVNVSNMGAGREMTLILESTGSGIYTLQFPGQINFFGTTAPANIGVNHILMALTSLSSSLSSVIAAYTVSSGSVALG